MKFLTLMRHAKSSWDNNSLSDKQRPLNKRGQKNASAAGLYLKEKNYTVEKVFSSDAERAKGTIDLIIDSFSLNLPLEFDQSLYTFSSESLLQFIYNIDDKIASVALVGHNPAMTNLLNHLLKTIFSENMPTCSIVELSIDSNSWNDIEKVKAKVSSFYTPKK